MRSIIQKELHRLTNKIGVYKLDNYKILQCSGSDAARFLNGQMSQNMLSFKPREAKRACLLTIRGKLVAVPICWQIENDFYLEISETEMDSVIARLEKYVVADDVSFSDVTQWGFGLHVTESAFEEKLTKEQTYFKIKRLGIDGVDIWFSSANEREAYFAELLIQGASEFAPEEIEFLRIAACIPKWGVELNENVLPAEAGLDHLAIDFHKGCYMGQEIISRMETAGRMRRELVVWSTLALFKTLEHAQIFGDNIHVGSVTSWITADAGTVGLAYLKSPITDVQHYEVRLEGDTIGMSIAIEKNAQSV